MVNKVGAVLEIADVYSVVCDIDSDGPPGEFCGR